MSIQFLGFRKAYVPSQLESEFGSLNDVQKLILCLHNTWVDQTVYIRDLPESIELAVVKRSYGSNSMLTVGLDRQSIETLIKVDSILDGFRQRKFLVGEIKPGDLAEYVLVTVKKEGTK